jgi:hypothetical protein
MTPQLARPGVLTWWHSTTSNTNEWHYEVEFCTSTNFADLEWTETFSVTNTTAGVTPAKQCMDVSGLANVYVRWRDTRLGGTAQRYISAVSVREALAAEKTTTGTGASITGLEPGKTYYVRVKAETATGDSDWSGVKTVQTAEAPATLTVTLTPEGGTWTVGGVMYANGAMATLTAGTYRVTFSAADGYLSPSAQNVTLVSGEARVLTVECEPVPVGVPVLGAGSGITTSAFSIAWSSVSGATKYTVQVAESATFDEGVALEANFADGAMPTGWATNKVTFANNKTTFSGDGTGVAVFAGKDHWLRTPLLARPGVMGWSHAKNTGSAAGTAWSYVVECSATEDFADVTWSEMVEVNDSVTVPVAEVADLTGQRNVYVRWRDTRASGTAQRYISEITVLDALSTETTTTGTSAAFSGLAASTVYYVRVKATTSTGDSDWSATQPVTTSDPPTAPAAPVLENATGVTENGFTIGWNAPSGSQVYHLQVSDVATFDDEPILAGDFSGDLPVGWETTGILTNSTTYALDGGSAVVFKGAGKFLRTPMVENPATLTWYHATGSTNEWRYELQASPTTDFSTPIPLQSVTVTQKLATAVKMTANLRNYRNVYLRWVDTRPSGTAQRFISGISLTGLPVLDLNGWNTTSRAVTGLSADTTYYVRVKAWGEGGWSDWSGVKSVTTSGGGSAPFDPYNPPDNPNLQPSAKWEVGATLTNDRVELEWSPVTGAKGYIVESRTDMMSGSWQPVCWTNNPRAITIDIDDESDDTVFYRLRAW